MLTILNDLDIFYWGLLATKFLPVTYYGVSSVKQDDD